MKLDHIGYSTDRIEDTKKLGFTSEPSTDLEAHKCKVRFLRKEGNITIEFVEPYEDNICLSKLSKNGVAPSCVCHDFEDIDGIIKYYSENDYVLFSAPLPAPAKKTEEYARCGAERLYMLNL